jgi:hypothetical protein
MKLHEKTGKGKNRRDDNGHVQCVASEGTDGWRAVSVSTSRYDWIEHERRASHSHGGPPTNPTPDHFSEMPKSRRAGSPREAAATGAGGEAPDRTGERCHAGVAFLLRLPTQTTYVAHRYRDDRGSSSSTSSDANGNRGPGYCFRDFTMFLDK